MYRPVTLVLVVTALLGCAPRTSTPPTAPPGTPDTTPTSSHSEADAPPIRVESDGTILVRGALVSGPKEAVESIRDQIDPRTEIQIADRSGGGESLTMLVAELRAAGASRVVVRFEEAPSQRPPDAPEGPANGEQLGEPRGSLPQVEVENIGLHIGGGPNDEAYKAPFKEAASREFDRLRGCYRLVEDPQRGGVFGLDLRIPREGGKPEIQAQRTTMGGAEFRKCVVDVFSSMQFTPPSRGPTVISYSVRFSLQD